jgi:hypothetical protein
MPPLVPLLALILCLAGCVMLATPPAPPPAGSQRITIDADRYTGFVVTPKDWDCRFVDPCETCINISNGPAELSIGNRLSDGRWEVLKRTFAPNAVVELCTPELNIFARRR